MHEKESLHMSVSLFMNKIHVEMADNARCMADDIEDNIRKVRIAKTLAATAAET